MKNDYEIRGDVTVVFLKRRKGVPAECLINTVDLPKVMVISGRWYMASNGYVYSSKSKNNTDSGILIHRLIMDAPATKQVDHFNNKPLDNTRENLRFATDGENKQNRKGAQSNNNSSLN